LADVLVDAGVSVKTDVTEKQAGRISPMPLCPKGSLLGGACCTGGMRHLSVRGPPAIGHERNGVFFQ